MKYIIISWYVSWGPNSLALNYFEKSAFGNIVIVSWSTIKVWFGKRLLILSASLPIFGSDLSNYGSVAYPNPLDPPIVEPIRVSLVAPS